MPVMISLVNSIKSKLHVLINSKRRRITLVPLKSIQIYKKSRLASKKVSLLLFIDLISKQNFLFYIKCFIAM